MGAHAQRIPLPLLFVAYEVHCYLTLISGSSHGRHLGATSSQGTWMGSRSMLTSCSTHDRVVLPKVAAENSGDARPQVGGVAPHGAAPQVCERVSVE